MVKTRAKPDSGAGEKKVFEQEMKVEAKSAENIVNAYLVTDPMKSI